MIDLTSEITDEVMCLVFVKLWKIAMPFSAPPKYVKIPIRIFLSSIEWKSCYICEIKVPHSYDFVLKYPLIIKSIWSGLTNDKTLMQVFQFKIYILKQLRGLCSNLFSVSILFYHNIQHKTHQWEVSTAIAVLIAAGNTRLGPLQSKDSHTDQQWKPMIISVLECMHSVLEQYLVVTLS